MTGKKQKYIALLLIFVLITPILGVNAFGSAPENTYTGTQTALDAVKNIAFSDVEAMGQSYWARAAIYDMAALSVIRGYGSTTFGPTDPISKVQALALIYRASDREAEAQQAAEIIERQRREDERSVNAVDMWADGFLQLAMEDGLITFDEYLDAISFDQAGLDPEYDFIKTAPAQRQEVGEWIARVLGLAPIYSQHTIFNSFEDWQQADPLRVPYLEAVLQQRIINGTPNGYLYPRGNISRAEMAQVLKNAEQFILASQDLTKKHGYIEKITKNTRQTMEGTEVTTVIRLRNADGKVDHISLQKKIDDNGHIIETSREQIEYGNTDVIVLGEGMPSDSTSLFEGQQISYIVDEQNNVRVIRILKNELSEQIKRAKIREVDYAQQRVTVLTNEEDEVTYQVSSDAQIVINTKIADFDEILVQMPVELTILNDIVVGLKVESEKGTIRDNEVTGIVEDIHPGLGYITLYDQTGKKSFNLLRIYQFLNPAQVEVIRNGRTARIEDVTPGDSVFLKLDDGGYVSEIAAKQNYITLYGALMSKTASSFLIRYEDGRQQQLNIEDDTIITKGGRIVTVNDVRPGQRVRVILSRTDHMTALKELTVETANHHISHIYKANIYYYEPLSDSLVVDNIRLLERGQWMRTSHRGLIELILDEHVEVLDRGKEVALNDINEYYYDREIYIAVEKGLGGNEKAVVISMRGDRDAERPYDDVIQAVAPAEGAFTLRRQYEAFNITEDTIIVKDGKMVTANNVSINDQAYIVANRSDDSGNFYAGIIEIQSYDASDAVLVYRGRIKGINDQQDFVVESFSRLQETGGRLQWHYYNTPKTFILTRDTRILDENGVVNNREFDEYSDRDYVGKVVNVVADDIEALMISEAPYGLYNVRGEVYLPHGKAAEDTLELRNVSIFNRNEGQWENAENGTITLREDTIILKSDTLSEPLDIVRGTMVKVLKAEGETSGEAIVVMIE